MAAKIIWAPSALADLRSIVRLIGRDNHGAVRRVGQQIIERTESLTTFPEKRRILAKFQNPDIRETILGSYRIFSWIAANAAMEDGAAGKKGFTPWWRVPKSAGKLNPKFPGDIAEQTPRLAKPQGNKRRNKRRTYVHDNPHAK